eukprot:5441811-Alexandrium_andersonii.AAC.1
MKAANKKTTAPIDRTTTTKAAGMTKKAKKATDKKAKVKAKATWSLSDATIHSHGVDKAKY